MKYKIVALSIFLASCSPPHENIDLPEQVLYFNGNKLIAEVAETEAEQSIGLMYRRTLDENKGMLFKLKHPQDVCLWMKNTTIPLQAAFIDSDGVVLQILNLSAPESKDVVCSNVQPSAVLEVNAGWFDHHGVTNGSVFSAKPL